MNVLKGLRFLSSALLLAGSSYCMHAQAPPAKDKEADVQALQQQLEAMQAQMNVLQEQIKKLTSTDSATPDSQGTPQAKSSDAQQGQSPEATRTLTTKQDSLSKATSEYQMNSQDQEAAPRYDNEPLDPKYPGYFRLPGTKTFMKIGGYAKSDFTFDPRPAGDQERFIPASIPIPPAANVNNSTVSVRPSRINVDFLVPYSTERSIRFFLEADFFGSSSTTPRLRHAYAQGKNLLIGQTFSTFMDIDASPDTLDFQGPNSWVSIRNPQMRYTFRFSKSTTASLAIEKPSSDVAFKTPEFSAQPNSPSPDGTLQLRHEASYGHVQFSALLRDVSAFLPNGVSDSVFGWGVNLAGLFKVGKKDNFVYEGTYGHGIERYINDTSGLGIDAAVKSIQDPELEAIPVVGTYGGFQHYWLSQLRSSVVVGFLQTENTAAQVNSAFHRSEYTAVNLIWSPLAQLTLGTEFLYGWRVNKDNSTGNAPRIQLSAKYNFMQMKSKQ